VLATFALRNYVLGLSSPPGSVLSQRRHALSLLVLTATGVVFRSELAVLVASQALYVLATQQLGLKKIIPAGLLGAVIGLAITVPIDSFFWQKYPIWPEWIGFYYNTILGQSSNWGTSPWYFYIANALPRLLFNPLIPALLVPIAAVSPATRKTVIGLLTPHLAFISIYSLLPHKEWRFIMYSVPIFNTAAALGASWIWTRRSKSTLYRTLSLTVLSSVIIAYIASAAFLAISSMNYPGGAAISKFHDISANETRPLRIYADNLACQTGVTRFLESRSTKVDGQQKYNFDKTDTESQLLDPLFWHQFDYALMEHQERCIGSWEVVDVVTAMNGIRLIRPETDLESSGNIVDDILLGQRHDLWHLWDKVGKWARTNVTKGWWITVNIVPKIKILRRIK
jgi:alpha-1,6-mannosyltransferase